MLHSQIFFYPWAFCLNVEALLPFEDRTQGSHEEWYFCSEAHTFLSLVVLHLTPHLISPPSPGCLPLFPKQFLICHHNKPEGFFPPAKAGALSCLHQGEVRPSLSSILSSSILLSPHHFAFAQSGTDHHPVGEADM